MSDNEYEPEQQQGNFVFPRPAGDCKKGDYIVLNGGPCKIMETSTSKTGKHGHAKSKITAINIFTGAKVEEVLPSSHNVECPTVEKKEYELVSLDGDFVTYSDEDGGYHEDLKLPGPQDINDFVNALKADYEKGLNLMLSITSAMGIDQIVGYKENKK